MQIKSHIIIVGLERAFDKIKHSFMVKTPQNKNKRKWLTEYCP